MAVPVKNTPKKPEEIYLDAYRSATNPKKELEAQLSAQKSSAQNLYTRMVEQGPCVNQLAAFAKEPTNSNYFAQVQVHKEVTSSSLAALRDTYLPQRNEAPAITRPAGLSLKQGSVGEMPVQTTCNAWENICSTGRVMRDATVEVGRKQIPLIRAERDTSSDQGKGIMHAIEGTLLQEAGRVMAAAAFIVEVPVSAVIAGLCHHSTMAREAVQSVEQTLKGNSIVDKCVKTRDVVAKGIGKEYGIHPEVIGQSLDALGGAATGSALVKTASAVKTGVHSVVSAVEATAIPRLLPCPAGVPHPMQKILFESKTIPGSSSHGAKGKISSTPTTSRQVAIMDLEAIPTSLKKVFALTSDSQSVVEALAIVSQQKQRLLRALSIAEDHKLGKTSLIQSKLHEVTALERTLHTMCSPSSAMHSPHLLAIPKNLQEALCLTSNPEKSIQQALSILSQETRRLDLTKSVIQKEMEVLQAIPAPLRSLQQKDRLTALYEGQQLTTKEYAPLAALQDSLPQMFLIWQERERPLRQVLEVLSDKTRYSVVTSPQRAHLADLPPPIREAFMLLNEKQQLVLRHRFSLESNPQFKAKTYEKIANELGVSKSRAGQLENEALRILKNSRHKSALKPWLDFESQM